MRNIFTLFLHAIVTIIRLVQPGGLRAVVAESILMRHQVLILNRGRKRAPNLQSFDRIIAGLCTLMMRPARVLRSAVVLKTSTLLHFHKMLIQHKYRLLFSPKRVRRPGPKGPTNELIDAVVEMKRRNRTWGCKRIAEQIALAFAVDIDKDVVRRILATHFHPEAGSGGPSWLSLIGNAKDSLWSLDLFRCESAILRTYWVLVVMDQFTRRIVGFAVHRGVVDGLALCRMFNRAIHAQTLPKYLSSDHDPLYRFHQWQANLRVLMVQEIKNSAVRSPIPSFRGETDRNDPAGILEPNAILDSSRFGAEAPSLPGLFQSSTSALGIGRTAARTGGNTYHIKF
jgi:putative transposase